MSTSPWNFVPNCKVVLYPGSDFGILPPTAPTLTAFAQLLRPYPPSVLPAYNSILPWTVRIVVPSNIVADGSTLLINSSIGTFCPVQFLSTDGNVVLSNIYWVVNDVSPHSYHGTAPQYIIDHLFLDLVNNSIKP